AKCDRLARGTGGAPPGVDQYPGVLHRFHAAATALGNRLVAAARLEPVAFHDTTRRAAAAAAAAGRCLLRTVPGTGRTAGTRPRQRHDAAGVCCADRTRLVRPTRRGRPGGVADESDRS